MADELRIGPPSCAQAMIDRTRSLKEALGCSPGTHGDGVQVHVGAAPHERSAERVGQRTDTASAPGPREDRGAEGARVRDRATPLAGAA